MELPRAASLTTVGRKPREMESDAVSPRHLAADRVGQTTGSSGGLGEW